MRDSKCTNTIWAFLWFSKMYKIALNVTFLCSRHNYSLVFLVFLSDVAHWYSRRGELHLCSAHRPGEKSFLPLAFLGIWYLWFSTFHLVIFLSQAEYLYLNIFLCLFQILVSYALGWKIICNKKFKEYRKDTEICLSVNSKQLFF